MQYSTCTIYFEQLYKSNKAHKLLMINITFSVTPIRQQIIPLCSQSEISKLYLNQ